MKRKKKSKWSIPRHKRLKRNSRLQAAEHWIPKYEGKNIVKGYSKHFAVNKLCAVKELQMLGVEIDAEYIEQLKITAESELKAKQQRKLLKQREKMFENSCDSDETFYYIAGYTEGGVPYGITWGEMGIEPYEIEEDSEWYDIPF